MIVTLAGQGHKNIIDERDGESINWYISSFSHTNISVDGDHDINDMPTDLWGATMNQDQEVGL